MDRDKLKDRVLMAMATVGCAGVLINAVGSLGADGQAADPTPGNSSIPAAELVSGFAQEYVTAYLTAKQGEEKSLTPYVTLKDASLPSARGRFTDVRVNYLKQERDVDGLAVWKVVVSGLTLMQSAVITAPQNAGMVTGNSSNTAPAETERKYYRVFISVLNNAPRATGRPVPADRTDIGVDLRLAYKHDTNKQSPLGETAAGFLTAYLTENKDFDFRRYVIADIPDKPLRPAPYVNVVVQKIQSTVDNNGDGAQKARLYVTFLATTKNNITEQLDCPLTLRSVEGKWQVEAIDSLPALQLQANDPSDQSVDTTTSSTPAPPPATRG